MITTLLTCPDTRVNIHVLRYTGENGFEVAPFPNRGTPFTDNEF